MDAWEPDLLEILRVRFSHLVLRMRLVEGKYSTNSHRISMLLPESRRERRTLFIQAQSLEGILNVIIDGGVIELESLHPR